MNSVSEQLINLEQSGLRMSALAAMSGVNQGLIHRMRHGTRPCSFENALRLHLATKGCFSVKKTHPDVLRLAEQVLKQGESNGMETQSHGTDSQDTTRAVQCEPLPEHSAAA